MEKVVVLQVLSKIVSKWIVGIQEGASQSHFLVSSIFFVYTCSTVRIRRKVTFDRSCQLVPEQKRRRRRVPRPCRPGREESRSRDVRDVSSLLFLPRSSPFSFRYLERFKRQRFYETFEKSLSCLFQCLLVWIFKNLLESLKYFDGILSSVKNTILSRKNVQEMIFQIIFQSSLYSL